MVKTGLLSNYFIFFDMTNVSLNHQVQVFHKGGNSSCNKFSSDLLKCCSKGALELVQILVVQIEC